jgi:hypothetical protein
MVWRMPDRKQCLQGWRCSSVADCLPSIHKALGLIPSTPLPTYTHTHKTTEKQNIQTFGRGEGEGRKLRWWYMVDELCIPIWNRTKKPLAIALSGEERRLRGRNNGDNVDNAQYKSNQNCLWICPHIMNIS